VKFCNGKEVRGGEFARFVSRKEREDFEDVGRKFLASFMFEHRLI
jgi:hypothetical protein